MNVKDGWGESKCQTRKYRLLVKAVKGKGMGVCVCKRRKGKDHKLSNIALTSFFYSYLLGFTL